MDQDVGPASTGATGQGDVLPPPAARVMTRKERREFQVIAAYLRTLRVELPTDPLQLMLHWGFYGWALDRLEGRGTRGRPRHHSQRPAEQFYELFKQYKA